MHAEKIALDPTDAEVLYRKYLKNKHYERPEDIEIKRAYRLLSKGKLVIKALESIKVAGVDDKGYPKLAIARADAKHCWLSIRKSGSAEMSDAEWVRGRRAFGRKIEFPSGTFDTKPWLSKEPNRFSIDGKAIMPIIPAEHRPRRALESYHVLWEAEWQPTPPHDPFLLQRIGKSDLWLVLAQWDLTEVERAVLAGRIGRD
jgi:hypothetical protein